MLKQEFDPAKQKSEFCHLANQIKNSVLPILTTICKKTLQVLVFCLADYATALSTSDWSATAPNLKQGSRFHKCPTWYPLDTNTMSKSLFPARALDQPEISFLSLFLWRKNVRLVNSSLPRYKFPHLPVNG